MATDPKQLSLEASPTKAIVNKFKQRREIGIFGALLVMLITIAVTRPDIFFNWGSIAGIFSRLFRQISSSFIIAVGMTYLIISGEFDLSVGSMYAIGGIVFALLASDIGLPISFALLLTLGIGAFVGISNGIIVTKIGVPSLITTIGMLSILRGVALYLTPGGSVNAPDLGIYQSLLAFEMEVVGVELSAQMIWALVIFVISWVVLQKTQYGNHIYATGDDAEAARLNGIPIDRVKIRNFVLTSTLAALAGILSVAFFGSAFSSTGSGIELTIIAAVIIGGTNLFGGEGSLIGTFLGTLVIGLIPTLLVINGFAVEVQEFLTGAIIISAVVVDTLIRS